MKDYISFIILFSLLSCAAVKQRDSGSGSENCFYNYTISIGENINIDKSEAESLVSSVLKQNNESTISAEILIFGYSMGKELFSYSSDNSDNLNIETYPGRMDVLVKIKHNSNLKEVFFIKAKGNNKLEIMQKFAAELRKILCG